MNLPVLSPEDRRLIAQTWAFRASAERSAKRRLERLIGELTAQGTPQPLLDMAEDAIGDEERHITLCDELARRYGWESPPLTPTPHHPIGSDSLTDSDRLLYEMVAFCCITESINAAMLLTIRKQVKEPEIRETVVAILKDEINHSKLGWAYLQYARDMGRGDFLSRHLQRMFAGAGIEEIYATGPDARCSPRLAAFGELDHDTRTSIFRAASRDIILPGFERVGLETNSVRTWLSQFEPSLEPPPETPNRELNDT